jgi:hypothetical protein
MSVNRNKDIKIRLSESERKLIFWVGQRKGYRIDKSNHSQKSTFIRDCVLSYCRSYYKKYKEEIFINLFI